MTHFGAFFNCRKHDLSRLVGLLELVGGAVFLNPLGDNPVFYVVGEFA